MIQIKISLFKDGCEEFEAEINYCGCKRKIKKQAASDPNSSEIFWYNQTTCSMHAYNRGMGQKIIGFSLYGNYTDELM